MEGLSTNKNGVHQLLIGLKQHGVKYVIASPGSRNAPLSIAFNRDDHFKCYHIPDERSAAFYALGIAERTNTAVVLFCTSGSAILNYAPAISEAFYRNIPLIVVSADRPLAWTDQGDGQTIRQNNVLQNHVVGFQNLIEDTDNEEEAWWNKRIIDELLLASSTKKMPVHFNFPFHEPLYKLSESSDLSALAEKRIAQVVMNKTIDDKEMECLLHQWNHAEKRMVIVGQHIPNKKLNQLLADLSKDRATAILVENTSNMFYKDFLHCIDRTFNSIDGHNLESDFSPDLLVTIGGAVVSKKIKAFLRRNKPKYHWNIGEHFELMDTYQSLTSSIKINEKDFLEQFLQQKPKWNVSRFGEQWKQLDYLIQDKHFNALGAMEFSDMKVFSLLLDAIPENSHLHLGNSSVVRYAQLFDPISSIRYYANRGTSGIDGSTSTAIGASLVDEDSLHTFISGDISAFYDSNAFWNNHLPNNFRMFVINNGGGGIFKIIPGPDTVEEQDDFFVAKQNFSLEHICKAFDVNYLKASGISEIDSLLDDFYSHQENNRPVLMEIFTPHDTNDQVLKNYFKAIQVTPKKLDL
jgi:2-succinyl-5-enolpyruvyl-6-hydroxy-3-cyclohexene-1-carboxylate synthase